MTHADDDGMIMPPKVAPYQVAILPVVKDDPTPVFAVCEKLASQLKAKGIRVHLDMSDRRTPDKMWDAIKKGIPLRVEIGAREAEAGQVTHVRRDIGKDSKETCGAEEFVNKAQGLLEAIQKGLLVRAQAFQNSHIFDVKSVGEVREFYKADKTGFVRMDTALLSDPGFEAVKKEFSLTPRCLPFADEGRKVIVGKSY
mgnify:FL=1